MVKLANKNKLNRTFSGTQKKKKKKETIETVLTAKASKLKMLLKMLIISLYSWSTTSWGRGKKAKLRLRQPLANINECVEATQFKLTFSTNKGNSTLFNNWKIPVAWTYIMMGSKNTSSSLQCLLWVSWLEVAELFIESSSYCGFVSFLHSEFKRCCSSGWRGWDMKLTGSSSESRCSVERIKMSLCEITSEAFKILFFLLIVLSQ